MFSFLFIENKWAIYHKLKVLLCRIGFSLFPHVVGCGFSKVQPAYCDLKTSAIFGHVDAYRVKFFFGPVSLTLFNFDLSAWNVTFHTIKVDLKREKNAMRQVSTRFNEFRQE